MEHLGLGYIAAALRQVGIETDLIDAHLVGMDLENLMTRISASRPLVVGLTASGTAANEAAAEVARRCKYSGVSHVCIGGYYPTFNAAKVLRNCEAIDSVIRGEGERAMIALVTAVALGDHSWREVPGVVFRGTTKIESVPPAAPPHIDTLPNPARDTLPDLLRLAEPVSIVASRGCAHDCAFCQIHEFYRLAPGPSRRLRSPSLVVDELEQIVAKGARSFFFVDDEFVNRSPTSRTHARSLMREIIARRLEIRFAFQCRCDAVADDELFDLLAEAGAFMAFLGVESGVQRTLDSFGKRSSVDETMTAIRALESRGLLIDPGYILWDFDTTWAEMQETVTFLRATPAIVPLHLHGLEPLPGTRVERTLREQGRLVEAPHAAFSYVRDARVELFARLVSEYSNSPIYTKCVQLAHALLFGDFDPRTPGAVEWFDAEITVALADIRRLHVAYLSRLFEIIESNDLSGLPKLNREMATEFRRGEVHLEALLADNDYMRKVAM